MFVGREREMALLKKAYESAGKGMVVVYGREGIGKTALIRQIVQDKPYVYYQARELSEAEQNHYFSEAKKELDKKVCQGKRVCFILDEFDLMMKGYKTFFEDFSAYYQELTHSQVLVILLSSAVQWVENSMVKDMGELASHIASFVKLHEFTFMEMMERFPNNTTEECIAVYGILGGVPAYLNLWNERETVKRNIIRLILDDRGPLHREAQRFLKTSLRELPFYSTILSVLAEDHPKLNYLYSRTGFSRAKISVYIKNLIQIDVAEKIFSFETNKKAQMQKGLYAISDPFIQFWYKLIYPNLSALSIMEPEDFYVEYVYGRLDEIIGKAFVKVCREFLVLMNRCQRLPVKFGNVGSLYGTDGFVPLIADSPKGRMLVGTCKWNSVPMNVEDFKQLLKCAEQTGREADYYYLFSKSGFTTELAAMAKNMDNIQCIDLEDL